MEYKLLNGKLVSDIILKNIKENIIKKNLKIGLAIILIGDDLSSKKYIETKSNACNSVGIQPTILKFNGFYQDEIINKIMELNNDVSINGILVQLPIPDNVNKDIILNAINPKKDVDGLTNINKQKLIKGDESLAPATPKAILKLLKFYNISLSNKNIVLVGMGNLVGKPLSIMLKNKNVDFISCDEYTDNIKEKVQSADILITATGCPHLIKEEWVKNNCVIVDAGFGILNEKVVGDVDFENVKNKTSYITPKFGGVGPMTVATLIDNLYNASINNESYEDLKNSDPLIFDLIKQESLRLQEGLEMIPSENFVSKSVLEALGSTLTNKYSEGYPKKRYYGGNQIIDQIEELAINRAKKLFGAEHVNVQPYSGSPANLAVYSSILNAGDKIMGMNLTDGGHLTHGHHVSFTGQNYNFVHYGVDRNTNLLDYDKIRELAIKEKPKIIVCGATAYPRIIDFEKFANIAKEVGAVSVADISHISGLVISKDHPSPFPHIDIVTSTTHKTLRGPRGAIIMCKKEFAKKIDKAVFPGLQGGPHNHQTAAIAVALNEALSEDFIKYANQIVKNSKVLAQELINQGLNLVTNGTDNHLVLIDLTNFNCKGKEAEIALDLANITVNKNTIPNEPRSPFDPSGIRIGTPMLTTRGMKEKEMVIIAQIISRVIKNHDNDEILLELKEQVKELCKQFPLD